MRKHYFALVGMLLLSTSIFSQEIGSVKSGVHSIRLIRTNYLYACVYSDTSSESLLIEKSFHFSDKNAIYKIIINGFDTKKNHQIFVQTGENTIVKFDYKRIQGIMMLKIKHNDLETNTLGESTFLTKEQILELFQETTLAKI